MTEEEWTAHQRDLFWNGVEDMLLAITSAITLLALIALIIIQVMEWMS